MNWIANTQKITPKRALIYPLEIFTMLLAPMVTPIKRGDRIAKNLMNIKATTRQVPEYPEEGEEDNDKTDQTCRIFCGITAEEYQERYNPDSITGTDPSGTLSAWTCRSGHESPIQTVEFQLFLKL